MKRAMIIIFAILLLIFFTVCITLSIVTQKESDDLCNRIDAKIESYYGKGVK